VPDSAAVFERFRIQRPMLLEISNSGAGQRGGFRAFSQGTASGASRWHLSRESKTACRSMRGIRAPGVLPFIQPVFHQRPYSSMHLRPGYGNLF